MSIPRSLEYYFTFSKERLSIGGIEFDELISAYGSPLYVYDLSIVRKKYHKLRDALPPHVQVYYAVKSNPNPDIIRTLASMGCGFDAASMGELYTLKKIGIDGSRIVFTGPGKRDAEILFALDVGIRSFNCESFGEIERINRFSASRNTVTDIGLRIHTRHAIEESSKIIGGASVKKFGIDENAIDTVIVRCSELSNIRVVGFHVFNASQILDDKLLAKNTMDIVSLSRELASRHGLDLTYIDVGGGLGIPYAGDESELDVHAFGKALQGRTADQVEWILEPGRYLSGECGVLLTGIVDVKETAGQCFVITEAGINTFLRTALVGQNHPVVVAERPSADSRYRCRIEGPLCTALDNIGMDLVLPDVKPGETLAIFNAGAYGFTESMPFFLSHPVPAEVIVGSGKHRLSRKRQEPGEYIDSHFVWP